MLEVKWDERGLAPAIVVDAASGTVRMLGWMNQDALERTLASGLVWFYSRSRQAMWQKGETSGNTLAVREVRVDCDGDAICVLAEPHGPTCHTGASSCFYRVLAPGEAGRQAGPEALPKVLEDDGPDGPPAAVLDRLEAVLIARRDSATAEKSYTKSLITGGPAKILAKIAEEQAELAAELPEGEPHAVVHEAADLIFHVMVGLVARGIPVADVWSELGRRFGVSGHVEKAARAPK